MVLPPCAACPTRDQPATPRQHVLEPVGVATKASDCSPPHGQNLPLPGLKRSGVLRPLLLIGASLLSGAVYQGASHFIDACGSRSVDPCPRGETGRWRAPPKRRTGCDRAPLGSTPPAAAGRRRAGRTDSLPAVTRCPRGAGCAAAGCRALSNVLLLSWPGVSDHDSASGFWRFFSVSSCWASRPAPIATPMATPAPTPTAMLWMATPIPQPIATPIAMPLAMFLFFHWGPSILRRAFPGFRWCILRCFRPRLRTRDAPGIEEQSWRTTRDECRMPRRLRCAGCQRCQAPDTLRMWARRSQPCSTTSTSTASREAGTPRASACPHHGDGWKLRTSAQEDHVTPPVLLVHSSRHLLVSSRLAMT